MAVANTTSVEEIKVGDKAPDFTLDNENGEKVTLSQHKGTPVVLMFYPFDWSGTCTKEVCEVRDMQPDWQETGAVVYGISRDSKHSHRAWKEHLGLGYSLLADLKGNVARLYGAWNEELARADRMTVVIDGEGVVRYVVHNESGTARNQQEIFKAVREMK